MTKEFVPYELAVKLEALGFDEPCLAFYLDNDKKSFTKCMERADTNTWLKEHMKVYGDSTTAPLFQQAFRWFREKGYRFNMINDVSQVDGDYFYDVWFNGNFIFESHYIYKTYEEAELACLTKLIEIVEQTNN